MPENVASRQGPIDTLAAQRERQQERLRRVTGDTEAVAPDAPRQIKTRRVGPGDPTIPRPAESGSDT